MRQGGKNGAFAVSKTGGQPRVNNDYGARCQLRAIAVVARSKETPMNRTIQVAMTVTALAASGCLMTRGGDLPELAKSPASQPAPQTTLSYQFHWLSSGDPNPAVGAIMGEPIVGPELTQSGAFKQVSVGQGGESARYHREQPREQSGRDHHGRPFRSYADGFARVCAGPYDMTAVLSRNGAPVKRYEYSEHVTMVMELLLVFGMPFVEGQDAPKNAIRDMTRHLVQDMRADGSLSGKAVADIRKSSPPG